MKIRPRCVGQRGRCSRIITKVRDGYVRQISVLDLIGVFKVFQYVRYVINCVNIWSTNGQLTVHETQFHMRYEYLQLSKHIIVGISLAAHGVNYVGNRFKVVFGQECGIEREATKRQTVEENWQVCLAL